MTVFRRGPVRVAAPASSANLGPGFDSLGLALSMHDVLEARVTGRGLQVEVTGAESDAIACDESHLVVVAMREAFAAMGDQPPGLALRCQNQIPHGRGLGSSAAAIVGGIVLARTLVENGDKLLDERSVLRIAGRLEGHLDNVAACLLGGLTIAWSDTGGDQATHLEASAHPVVFVPPRSVATRVARDLLPASVAHADAARNSGRTALLVAALCGHPELLFPATEDFLHQRSRANAMPDSYDLVATLRGDGVAAVISGAGPTVLAFAEGSRSQSDLTARAPQGWLGSALSVEPDGAREVRG